MVKDRGMYVYLWWIYVDVHQKPSQYYRKMILQWKIKLHLKNYIIRKIVISVIVFGGLFLFKTSYLSYLNVFYLELCYASYSYYLILVFEYLFSSFLHSTICLIHHIPLYFQNFVSFKNFIILWYIINVFNSSVQQCDSIIPVYIIFKFFSHLGYNKILSRVPNVIQ